MWMKGFSLNESLKEGYPPPLKEVMLPLLARIAQKRLQENTDMLLIITSTGHGLFIFINMMTLNDLEPLK